MNKRSVEKYAETEIMNGKTKQEIFNDVVSTSDLDIHHVAEIIRKIPNPEKRKKYQALNDILKIMLVITIIANTLLKADVLTLLSIIIPIVSVYGIHNFKRNAHLLTALFMVWCAGWATVKLIIHVDVLLLIDVLYAFSVAILAFYLDAKLTGDYELDKELRNTT